MKEFFRLTLWKIIAAALVYSLINWATVIYLGAPYYTLLFSCMNTWCSFVKITPFDYFWAQVPTILVILIAYILACAVVWYIRQSALLEAQEKQKNSQPSEEDVPPPNNMTDAGTNTK